MTALFFDVIIAADIQCYDHIIIARSCTYEQDRQIIAFPYPFTQVEARSVTEVDVQQEKRYGMCVKEVHRRFIACDIGSLYP